MVLFRFYRIVGTGTDEYIGSTKNTLSTRFGGHKSSYRRFLARKGKKCGSFDLFKIYGVENCQIELISEKECESKKEARIEERRIYDERRDIIVNLNRPYASVEESKELMKEYSKEYRQENKDKIKNYYKEYCIANKERMKENQKANRDKRNAQQRERRRINRAKSIL